MEEVEEVVQAEGEIFDGIGSVYDDVLFYDSVVVSLHSKQ